MKISHQLTSSKVTLNTFTERAITLASYLESSIDAAMDKMVDGSFLVLTCDELYQKVCKHGGTISAEEYCQMSSKMVGAVIGAKDIVAESTDYVIDPLMSDTFYIVEVV